MLERHPASLEMRTPAIVSGMVHVFVLAAAVLNLDLFGRPPPLEPEPVMVEFEAIDKKAAAPTVGNPPPQPKDVPIAQETTKAPPPKSAEPPPAPTPPKPEVAEAKPPTPPKPEEKPKPEAAKPAEELVALKPKEPEPPKVEQKPPEPPKPAPEVKKPDPPKPPPPKPAPPKQDRADAVLDDILKNKQSPTKVQTPEQQPKPVQQVTRQAPAAPQLSAVVTASEIEGVRQKIRPCWNTQGGARDQGMIITLVVDMNPNGTPISAELRDPGRYNSDPVYRAAADAARRAILNPRCQPWPLSQDKFNSWKQITFNFDPRDY
jgi:outer membrane biosynthesis protein TonB